MWLPTQAATRFKADYKKTPLIKAGFFSIITDLITTKHSGASARDIWEMYPSKLAKILVFHLGLLEFS